MALRNEKHGGETAVSAIRRGLELTGPAAEIERTVREELELDGRLAIVTKQAIRLEAAARLFYGLVVQESEHGSLERLDTYVKRYGWLAGAALRAWAQVKEEQKKSPVTVENYELILEAQRYREMVKEND